MTTTSKSQLMSQIKKKSKTISDISIVLFIILTFAALFSGFIFMKTILTENLSSAIPEKRDGFFVTWNKYPAPSVFGEEAAISAGLFLYLVLIAGVCLSIAKAFTSIAKKGRPFSDDTYKAIKFASVICLLSSFLPNAVISIFSAVFEKNISFELDAKFSNTALCFSRNLMKLCKAVMLCR